MLSRVADTIYWTARYVERASNTARFLEASYYMNLDLTGNGEEQWSPLVEITGDMPIFKARYGEASRENVMHFLMFNPEYPNSIARCLSTARDNARGLREILPPDLFEELNTLGKMVPEATREKAHFHSRVFELCREIKHADMHISGIVSETMERGQGYHFWRTGEYLERADKTSRLLNVKYFYLLPQSSDVGTTLDDLQWGAMLQSLDATEIYSRNYGLIDPHQVIRLIVLDRGFPRSILFCLRQALNSLYRITDDLPQAPHELLQQLLMHIKEMSPESIINFGLHEFIDDLQIKLNGINNSIFSTFNPEPQLQHGE
ncbi:MAG: alpha-E domain-containing protein [Pontiellaceae bacterium]|nr:alpha-E domain-containing protein [Pontiellaceae bacterium]MBN2783466.1 alpha-E domain-containing protein [Pontiellaceae bacterium]